MEQKKWNTLLNRVRQMHEKSAEVQIFCPFPDDVTPQVVVPHHTPVSNVFQRDAALISKTHSDCVSAIQNCCDIAYWRETYAGTNIGDDFLNRFGCYAIIGPNGPFTSDTIRSFIVYMPPNLWYPWHHHPAEELYFILAGSALFRKVGADDRILNEGDAVFHTSNQPHATQTQDTPVLAYVVWRDEFETAPVLSGI